MDLQGCFFGFLRLLKGLVWVYIVSTRVFKGWLFGAIR